MPFTLAHPAAVLPLRHIPGLRIAPLIIGAIVPDLPPYYTTAAVGFHLAHLTHRPLGALLIDLPMGIAVLVCVFLLREPLTVLLPARGRWLCLNALEPFRRSKWEWVLAPVAILIGVWTHLLWDSFTHLSSWGCRHFPVLQRVVTLLGYTGTVCHSLQYVSSAVGLAIMVLWYWLLRAPAEASAGHATRRASAGPALLLVAGAALLIGGVQAWLYYWHSEGAIYRTLDVLLTRSLAWFLGLYLFAGSMVALEHRAHG